MLDIRNNAIQNAPEEWNLWSENMQLSVVQGDPLYPAFVNPQFRLDTIRRWAVPHDSSRLANHRW